MPPVLAHTVVTVSGRRTAARLEPQVLDALADIQAREGLARHALLTAIDDRRGHRPLSSALRVFALVYYRVLVDDPTASPPALSRVLDRAFGPSSQSPDMSA